jgi:hypothetical protein
MPRFEVYVYSDASRPDATSERLKTLVQHWKDVRHLSDQKLAELILADGIDILVDLAGHTAQNRLMVFAQKPGAVQMTYLGYPNTTGLPASVMNYRITDSVCDPPGQADELHTEKLLRIDCGIDVEGSACAEAHPTKDGVLVGPAPRTAPCAGMNGTGSDRGKSPHGGPYMSDSVGSALRTVAGEQEETPTGDGKEADAGRAGPLAARGETGNFSLAAYNASR